MTARLRIERAGPLTSVQDAGRPGWRRYGVPPSGPVDRAAFAAANAALGNPAGVPAIELSHGGLALTCEAGDLAVALTAAATGTIDGEPIGGWTTAMLFPGTRLVLRPEDGNWGYLALAGALQAPAWLGSHATHLIAGLGGGAVAAGQILTIADPRGDLAVGAIPPPPADAGPFRLVVGPQDRFFASETVARLTGASFIASSRSDRMGFGLDGPALPPTAIDMPSEPAIRGALQVDGDGRLSLLTADHQTTGGYPRIATVIDADVDRLAQSPAGSEVRFVAVSPEQAVARHRAAHAARADWLARIAAGVRPRPLLRAADLTDGLHDE